MVSLVSVAVSATESLKIQSQNLKILCNITNFRECIGSVLGISSIAISDRYSVSADTENGVSESVSESCSIPTALSGVFM